MPPLNVQLHRATRSIGISLLHGVDDALRHLLVRSGNGMPASDLARYEKPQAKMEVEYARDRFGDEQVVGRRAERVIELAVELHVGIDVIDLGGVHEFLVQRAHLCDLTSGGACGGEPRGIAIDERAKLINLLNAGGADLGDEHAAVR